MQDEPAGKMLDEPAGPLRRARRRRRAASAEETQPANSSVQTKQFAVQYQIIMGAATYPQRGKSHSSHEKGNRGHEFQCDGAKCINPCFEAATAPNQTREPVRNEDERPFPAFEFGNEWTKE
jgi:hypothetical protein